MYQFRLLKYIKCIACIIFKVTFTHFPFQIIISNISLKLQANRQRMTIGDQGCTWVGSRVPAHWHPWSFWGALCFCQYIFI